MDFAREQTKLPSVTQVILKRRKAGQNTLRGGRKKNKNPLSRKGRFSRQFTRRPEQFVKVARKRVQEKRRLRRLALQKPKKDVEASVQPRLIFVIRIKGRGRIPNNIEKILNLLRLKNTDWAVFTLATPATLCMLAIAKPYITWGYPNLKSVRELIYKRGAVKLDGKRKFLSDNMLIENRLGHLDIVCMEDIIHEIHTVGPNFKEVINFLCPFLMNNPSGGWDQKDRPFDRGGDFGCRNEAINDLLRRMV